MNCDPSHALPTDERKKYREDFEAVLREHKMEAVCWVYVPQLDLKIDEATKQYESPAVAVVRNELWSKINLLRAEKHKELCQRETVERQRAAQAAADQQRQAEAKAQQAAEAVSAQQLEQQRQAAVALEQQRQAQVAALLQEQAAAAVAAQAAAAAQAAEQARLQALADAQPYPVRCEQARGNPCQRYVCIPFKAVGRCLNERTCTHMCTQGDDCVHRRSSQGFHCFDGQRSLLELQVGARQTLSA